MQTLRTPKLPPRQRIVTDLPTHDLGVRPHFNTLTWRLRIHGEVRRPLSLHQSDIVRLPMTEQTGDFHCVNHLSAVNICWAGPTIATVIEQTTLTTRARFAVLVGADGFMVELPLSEILSGQSLLALECDGQQLTAEHGAPVRFVQNGKYGCRHVKWLTEITFTNQRTLEPSSKGSLLSDPWLIDS